MAGCVLASLVFTFPELPASSWMAMILSGLVICVAALMVSRVRYRSFRELDLRNRRSYIFVLPIAAILVAVVMRPKIVLPVLCIAYLLSGPVLYLRDRRTLRSGSRDLPEGRSSAGPYLLRRSSC